jgi:copper chaperone NosL
MARRSFLLCAFCVATAAVATACNSAARSGEPQPPEIAYGRDTCEQCGMVISEPRFACATVLEDGTVHKFDDIGDLVMYHFDRPDQRVRAYFAHDYTTEAWIRAEKAFFVHGDRIKSPMGSGLIAFGAEADAQAYAGQMNDRVMTFDDMRADVHVRLHGQA